MVLDRIIGPARQQPSNLCPAVAKLLVGTDQNSLLICSPRATVDIRVELVMPPVSIGRVENHHVCGSDG